MCLHFHLDSTGGALQPCTLEADAPQQQSVGSRPQGMQQQRQRQRQYSVEESTIQLGGMVRKGVGGTCPLRQVSLMRAEEAGCVWIMQWCLCFCS